MAELPSLSSADLGKLTVPQLKAICKERRITGYSKLPKPGLLQKIAENGNTETKALNSMVSAEGTRMVDIDPGSSSTPTVSAASTDSTGIRADQPLKDIVSTSLAQEIPIDEPVHDIVDMPSHSKTASSDASEMFITSRTTPHCTLTQSTTHPTPGSVSGFKRRSEYSQLGGSLTKKLKPSPDDSNTSSAVMHPPPPDVAEIIHTTKAPTQQSIASDVAPRTLNTIPTKRLFLLKSAVATLNGPSRQMTSSNSGLSSDSAFSASNSIALKNLPISSEAPVKTLKPLLPITKRFRPLVVKKTVPNPEQNYSVGPQSSTLAEENASTCPPMPLYRLDFPIMHCDSLVLSPITLPPKLSTRKHVYRWSVILSGLSNQERKQCSLVSRILRYSGKLSHQKGFIHSPLDDSVTHILAVYLSAARILEQKFKGSRLTKFALKNHPNMTNMWPYLRQRELEANARMQIYKSSYLANYFKDFLPFSEHLCNSPDNEKQITVAVRFILTRLWFLISIGTGGNGSLAWSCGVVIDTQEVVKDEIWAVTIRIHSKDVPQMETFYVLEQTCEVIGHPLAPARPEESLSPSPSQPGITQIRADWSAYIAHRRLPVSAQDSPPMSLISHLKWQNHEEYHQGISKLWLKNIAKEKELGIAKRVAAERYLLACVAGNSISGRWMSSTQMEQDFAGNSDVVPAKAKSYHVHLFLPAHHHVESLHFSAADGRPLHAAVAVVQTPAREYYILRDNGMQIGCEEDGISEVWRDLLGCTFQGLSIFNAATQIMS